MPTYEYQCNACGHEFEQFQPITADPVKVCPKCKKRKVERKISIGAAVIFKGGGFYETDYRSDSFRKGEEQERKAGEAQAAAKADFEAGAKADPKSDSKGDPKGDPKAAPKNTSAAAGANAPSEAKPGTESKSGSTPMATPTTTEKTGTAGKTEKSEKPDPSRTGKSHAREGRGIGNVLQIGRGKASYLKHNATTKPASMKPRKRKA